MFEGRPVQFPALGVTIVPKNQNTARGGCVESRREQVRLQEELAMREKSLRDTQIRSRESHDTIQRLTSQKQELQEKVNCMNDSGEFQEVESNFRGHFSRSQSTRSYSKSTYYAKLRHTLAT